MNYRFAILLSLLLTSMILPSKRAFTDTILADIVADFSTNGTNPDNNWSHGQYMGSAGIAYTPADFELLPNWSLNSKMFYQDVSSSGYYALIQKRDVTGITGNWIYSVLTLSFREELLLPVDKAAGMCQDGQAIMPGKYKLICPVLGLQAP